MKLFAFHHRRLLVYTGLCLIVGMQSWPAAQDSSGFTFGGAGWMKYDLVGNSSANNYYNGKSVLSTGAQISFNDRVSDRLKIVADLGIFTGNALLDATTGISGYGYALPTTEPYVAEANFTYAFQNTTDSRIWVRGGLFPYTYNPDVKNLGLYLLRGPVYPGYILSGVETQGILPVGNMIGLPAANLMGLQFHQQWKGFQQDLLLSSETEFYPFFDVSPAYVASYQVYPAFRIGAGVNFYHLISVDKNLTYKNQHNYGVDYSDTVGGKLPDTTFFSFAGTKMMANAAFDPKPLMKSGLPFGPEDLKLYGEIALIGLENSKAYRDFYGDYLQRMPVMMGFNFPVFNYLDHLSLEVEWYGAPFPDNLSGYIVPVYGDINSQPYGYTPNEDVKRDNWKWSLYGSKTIHKHVTITLQVANDHYRPGKDAGVGDFNSPYLPAILVSPKDWHASTELSYCF